mmetsp:Transcript_25675/g.59183  ORF Transcript_25675/g.59183 Transcript_25675/m.59183 type:complete len:224 (+) Transcript_25675:35-706(+)
MQVRVLDRILTSLSAHRAVEKSNTDCCASNEPPPRAAITQWFSLDHPLLYCYTCSTTVLSWKHCVFHKKKRAEELSCMSCRLVSQGQKQRRHYQATRATHSAANKSTKDGTTEFPALVTTGAGGGEGAGVGLAVGLPTTVAGCFVAKLPETMVPPAAVLAACIFAESIVGEEEVRVTATVAFVVARRETASRSSVWTVPRRVVAASSLVTATKEASMPREVAI